MALGACKLFGSTVGVSTTGYADSSPEGVPYAYVCVVWEGEVLWEQKLSEALPREEFQDWVCRQVLHRLVSLVRRRK